MNDVINEARRKVMQTQGRSPLELTEAEAEALAEAITDLERDSLSPRDFLAMIKAGTAKFMGVPVKLLPSPPQIEIAGHRMALREDSGLGFTFQMRTPLPWGTPAEPKRQGMPDEVAADLRRVFGYVPDERGGEQWTVYQNQTLIVVHPERRPRLYKRGCGGVFSEIDPAF